MIVRGAVEKLRDIGAGSRLGSPTADCRSAGSKIKEMNTREQKKMGKMTKRVGTSGPKRRRGAQ